MFITFFSITLIVALLLIIGIINYKYSVKIAKRWVREMKKAKEHGLGKE